MVGGNGSGAHYTYGFDGHALPTTKDKETFDIIIKHIKIGIYISTILQESLPILKKWNGIGIIHSIIANRKVKYRK